ncbi:MAG: sigma-70 family RNA polymerase sigma factor [Planctomycetaceae bacterium]|nr:sigma-70 family RNA polymerase sigma factor [Planctomycetaceae bacterium]
MNNDDFLIDRTIQGDRDAFGRLVSQYQERLFNTMFRFTGNAEDTYDVVQETFFQAFLHLNTFRKSSKFYTWVYRIAFNVAMGIKRKKKAVSIFNKEGDLTGGYLETSPPRPDDILIVEENIELVKWAIGRLEEEFRSVIVLREIEDFSYEEISEILDIPIGTVRSRLHRARGILKEILLRKIQAE